MGTDSLTSLNSLEREQDEDMITNPETVFFLIKLASLNSLESARGQHAISNRKLLCLLLRLETKQAKMSQRSDWKTRVFAISNRVFILRSFKPV